MELEGKVTKGVGLRNGRDNNRGFRNGLTNGFTNGHGYSNGRNGRKLKESRSHGKVLAIFVFAMLVVSVVAVLTWQSKSAGTIRIDGRFEDWQGVAKCTKPRNDSVPANIDIAEYASADFGRNVAFYAEVHGSFLAGDGSPATETVSEPNVSFATQRETAIPNVNGRDVAYVFVDTDNNPATGFKPSQNFAVGADKAIEIVGKNGKIETSRVLTFAGVVQQEWTWNIGESVDAATNGKEMETMAGKGVLGIGESYAVYFYMIDWNGNKGMVDNAFRSENAKVSMSGLYLNSHAIARAKSMGMEVKGTSHAPIHINGNDDFANQAANEGWPGDGSEGNPYIIDGLEIDANGGTYGIWIENTDVYFVIRNCTVYSATSSGGVPYGTGIALNNVTHGTLESNKCNNSTYGIFLYGGSQYNTITNNNASGNSDCGICLFESSNNNITNNNASGNSYFGILLSSSSNNNITNNNASGNSWIGIYLDSSSNNIITYNWICNTVYYGVYITGGSTGNTIHHNNFIGNNGAGKGVNGSCQAYDSVGGNYWYDNSVNEGNYWSNWDHSGAYPIDGGAGASDPYPLVNPVAEFSSMPLFMLALASLLILARVRKPHKHS
ncbi:MAG: right-handed parallel beta-helix repeat-containing protein [Thermoplasmata archaeon]